jgi:hypothetical protein
VSQLTPSLCRGVAGAALVALMACGKVQPAVPADASMADGGLPGCVPTALITDVEEAQAGYGSACIRGGWTLEALNGTTVPMSVGQPSNTTLVVPTSIVVGSNPLARTSSFAIHVSGSGQRNVSSEFSYAQLTASLNRPTDDQVGTVDASAFTGIEFLGKLTAGATGVRLTVGNLYTDPAGGRCTPGGSNDVDCYDDPGAGLPLNDTWTRYRIPFTTLTQDGFGLPSPLGAAFPKEAITHIKWDLGIPETGETAPWELWVDELRFY